MSNSRSIQDTWSAAYRLFIPLSAAKSRFGKMIENRSSGSFSAVGVIFGIYPAFRAADMDPVKALRHE